MGYMLKGGAVPIPRWILIFRTFQFFFALLVIALTAYALSIYNGGPLRTPLIATIVIACLTIIPVLILTTPLHLAQRKIYDARIALLLDGFALLFWLAAFSALASYQDIFRYYGRNYASFVTQSDFVACYSCQKAWRAGVVATVFSAVEFVLFLITTLAFIYYYHFSLVGQEAPGLGRRGTNKGGAAAGVAAGAAATGTHGTNGTHGGVTGEQHQMSSLSPQTNTTTGNHGGLTGMHGTNGAQNTTASGPPYPETTPNQGGYGSYQAGSNGGYGANPGYNQA